MNWMTARPSAIAIAICSAALAAHMPPGPAAIAQERGELTEIRVDVSAWKGRATSADRWPAAEPHGFWTRMLARLLPMDALDELVVRTPIDGDPLAELRGRLSPDRAAAPRPDAAGGLDRGAFPEAASLIPEDAHLLLVAEGELEVQLGPALHALESSLPMPIDEFLRSTGEYRDAAQLLKELSELFRGRVALAARANDYEYVEEMDPPHDGREVQAWAVILWLDSESEQAVDGVDRHHNLVHCHYDRFGLKSPHQGERGVFRNEIAGGFQVWEFWNPLIPGTGHIATGTAGEVYLISNSYKMVEDVLVRSLEPTDPDPHSRLTDRADFRVLVDSPFEGADAALWFDPKSASAHLSPSPAVILQDALAGTPEHWRGVQRILDRPGVLASIALEPSGFRLSLRGSPPH